MFTEYIFAQVWSSFFHYFTSNNTICYYFNQVNGLVIHKITKIICLLALLLLFTDTAELCYVKTAGTTLLRALRKYTQNVGVKSIIL